MGNMSLRGLVGSFKNLLCESCGSIPGRYLFLWNMISRNGRLVGRSFWISIELIMFSSFSPTTRRCSLLRQHPPNLCPVREKSISRVSKLGSSMAWMRICFYRDNIRSLPGAIQRWNAYQRICVVDILAPHSHWEEGKPFTKGYQGDVFSVDACVDAAPL